MSFGFGIGDIIVVSNGIHKFWTTVHDASTEQADLRNNLEFLRQVVERITERAAILAPKLSPQITRPVGQQLSHCSKLLRNLDNIVAKYMGECSVYGGPGRGKQNRRLLMWGACKRDEFVESLNNLGKVVLLLVSYAMFEGLENKLSLALTDTADCQTIRFIDALDRESVCSMRLCDTWEGLEDFIKFNFNRSAGKTWVEAGRYNIRDESAGGVGILTAEEWKKSIRAGMTVSMAMVLQKQQLDNNQHHCPSCNTPYIGLQTEDLERVQCKFCGRFFQVSSVPRIEELPDDITELEGLGGSSGGRVLMKPGEYVDMDELQHFRRLHDLLSEDLDLKRM